MTHRALLLPLAVAVSVALARAQAATPAVAAEPPVVIAGQVVDMLGNGMPSARVEVVVDERVVGRSIADGEGRFRIGKVAPGGPWVVRADVDGKSQGGAWVGRASLPARVVLHECATVRGFVQDREGNRVAGTIVRATDRGRSLAFDRRATTQPDGTFTFERVPLGPMMFAAAIPGQGLGGFTLVVDGDREIVLAPSGQPTTALELTVAGLPDGAHAHTNVLLHGNNVGWLPPPWQRPQLDAAGTCRFADLPCYDFNVSVSLAGHDVEPRTIELRGPGPYRPHFVVQPRGAPVPRRAAVRDGEGRPVGGARLALRSARDAESVVATSDATGTVEFGCPFAAGSDVLVESRDPRWVVVGSDARDPVPASHLALRVWPTGEVTVLVRPACTVAGKVLLADGGAAAFVVAALEVPYDRAQGAPQWLERQRVVTGADGRFQFDGVHPHFGTVRVTVVGEAGAARGEPIELQERGPTVARDVRLAPPSTIEGVARDARGKPAVGARVWLRVAEPGGKPMLTGNLVEVVTGRDGRYRFVAVPPGDALLQVAGGLAAPGTNDPAIAFAVAPGSSTTHDLAIPPQ